MNLPIDSNVPLDDAQWRSLRSDVEAETGMDLSGTRLSRLQDAVRRLSARRPAVGASFVEQLTAELTVGESFFFRNEHHFRALRERVMPEIMGDNAATRHIRAWSAGCAGGEEPYSLAIMLDQLAPAHDNWRVSILGTDLNPDFLHRAREAKYRKWSFRQTNIHDDASYFSLAGDDYRLAERIRDQAHFAYLNLVKDVYPSAMTGTLGLDLILFRNVAIYLRPEVTAAILQRLRRSLRPGGWLLLGESEVSLAPTVGFEVRRFPGATLFQTSRDQPPIEVATIPPAYAVAGAAISPGESPWRSVIDLVGASPSSGGGFQKPSPSNPPDRTRAKSSRAASATPQTPLPSGDTRSGAICANPETPWETVCRFVAERSYARAEQALDRVAAPCERAGLRLRYARLLLAGGESDRARRMVETCVAEEPLLIEGQLTQAGLAADVGELVVAEQACRRALYLDRGCAMAHFQLGLVLQQQHDESGAARSFRTALDLARERDPLDVVEFGEGACFGRFGEMLTAMIEES